MSHAASDLDQTVQSVEDPYIAFEAEAMAICDEQVIEWAEVTAGIDYDAN